MDYVVADLGRRQRKRQEVHQRLIEAAIPLFEQRGIARTTVDDIAEAADVARQTFFNHFSYKEALVVEVASEGIQKVAEQANAWLEMDVPALDVLRSTADSVLDAAVERGEMAVIVAQELLHIDPERATHAAQQIPLVVIFQAILEQAREEGAISDRLPLDIVASHFSSILRCIIARILVSDPNRLRHELNVWFDLVFEGIVQESRTYVVMEEREKIGTSTGERHPAMPSVQPSCG